MSERVINIFDMFVRTERFDATNAPDYAEFAETVVQFGVVREVIAAMQTDFADQISGAEGAAVEAKSVVRHAMRRKLKRFAKVARALNIDEPGIRRLFRIPDENSDQKLIAFAREVVEQAGIHKAAFGRLAMTQPKIDAVKADADQLEDLIGDKGSAHLETVGATAGLDDQIEKGMKSENILDAMMEVIYEDDAEKLREWKSARHIKSSKKKPALTEGKDEPES